MKINKGNYGEKLYKVTVGTGTAWVKTFEVYAYHEQEAVDLVADYCQEHEDLQGLWGDHYELADICDLGQTVEEYAEANGLTCCGNSGIYLNITNIEEVV